MRALCIDRPRSAALIEVPDPRPGPGEVLLRLRRIGLCGTDLNIYRGLMPLARYPRIPGHELSGVIEEVGAGVPAPWRPGLSVTCSPYTACGNCSSCRAARPNACRDNQTLGVQRDGGLSEWVVLPWQKLFHSATLSLEALALVEPFSVGFHAATRGRVAAGETVLVLGCGTIGLGAVTGAASRGARVIGADVDEAKLALARRLGAELTVHPGREDLAARLGEWTAGHGPQVVIEAIGLATTYRQAVELAAYCGRVVYIGYAKEPVAYETKLFVMKELDILGSRNALDEFPEVISCFERGGIDPEVLISRRVPLDEAPEALAAWDRDPARTTKIMVTLEG